MARYALSKRRLISVSCLGEGLASEGTIVTEGPRLEHKRSLDPAGALDRLKLVKEVVAMANADGGRILVGVADDGSILGVQEDDVEGWDPAVIGDLLDSFVNPDHVDLSISMLSEGCPAGTVVVEIRVQKEAAPPLVLCKDGNHGDGSTLVFRKNDVLIRHNTKVERARRSDYQRWREEQRNRILQQFQMVMEAPETAHLRMVDSTEVRDEPNYLLSRATDLFRQRREKLLDGDDLLYLFANRASLASVDEMACELLVHSALRRLPTLFFWLANCHLDEQGVAAVLDAALDMRDRDKSDMARVVPLVAALYLRETEYDGLIATMAASDYAHIRNAADEFASLDDAQAAIRHRRESAMDGRQLSDFSDEELLAAAEDLTLPDNRSRASRRMPNLGLEYLARKLNIAR